jgi:hypothetical protein
MADLNALIAQGAQFNMPDQLGQYAKMQQLQQGQQQMRTAALQEQTAGMQLDQLKQDRDNMAKLSQQLSVKGISPRQYFEALQTSGDPKHQQLGVEGLMKLDATEKYDTFLKSQQTIPAQQAPMPMAGGLGSGTFGMDNVPGMPAPTNALASRTAAPMASTNALATQAADPVAALETKIAQLRSFNDPRAQAEAARLQKQVDQYNQGHVVAPGASLVVGGKSLFTAPDKAATLTTLAKLQTELAALPPSDPRRAQYLDAIRKETQFAPQASTTINMPPQEKAEQSGRGTLLVEQYKDVSKAAKNAVSTLPALETQAAILDAGFKTGFGTDTQKVGASLLGALGVPEAAKFATDSQKFLGAAQQAVLQKQLEQKGPQTESDAQRISQTGAQLGNTVEANRFMIDVAKSQLKRDIEQRNFYDSWWKQNKTYNGAEDAWFNGEGGKSLFNRAELKKYAAPQTAPAFNKPAANGLSSAEQAELAQLRKRFGK